MHDGDLPVASSARSVSTPDGATLGVREAGDPAGVPVLFHSGTPGAGMLYEPHVRDAEEKGIRLFSYDRPGYGASSRRPGRNVADCASDVEAVCDALGVGRFCVWGVSGGGPHALATAALLPDRVAAAASLASVAPFDADGLDFLAGMGEQNVEEISAVLEGEDAHLAVLERDRRVMLAAAPDELVEAWSTLLDPVDREAVSPWLATYLLESTRVGIAESLDGWFDDDIAFVSPWGFDLGSIRVPVLYWHGEHDRFVPIAHGRWLADRIPGVEARLSPGEGHLTLGERRVPEVHAWLLERFGG